MFKPNTKHLQQEMFDFINSLPESLQKEIIASEEYLFYDLIFTNIREEDFACLYSHVKSRSNVAVNILVGSFLLKERYN